MSDCKNCKHLIMYDYKNKSYSCELGECEFELEEQEPILDKVRAQIKSNLRGVGIALEVLVENHPLRSKMEGAKDTLEDCLEIIDKAESERNTND